MSNDGEGEPSEAGQVEADVYFICPMCTFPQNQRPPQPGELIVPLEMPNANAIWYYYCTECRYPMTLLPEGFQGRFVAMPLPEGMNRGGSSGYPDAQSTGDEEDTPLPRDYRPVHPNPDELDPPPPYTPPPPYPGLPVSMMYEAGQRSRTSSESSRNRADSFGQTSTGAHQPMEPGDVSSSPAQQSMNPEEDDPYGYLFDSFPDTTSGSGSSGSSSYSTRNPTPAPPPPAQQQRPSFAERFQFRSISPETVPPNRFQAFANESDDSFDNDSDTSYHSGHSARSGVQRGQPQRPSLAERFQFQSIPPYAVPPNRFQAGSRQTRPSYPASRAMVSPTPAATANLRNTGSFSGQMVPVSMNFLNRPSGMSTTGPMDQQGTGQQQPDPANGTLPPMAPMAPLPAQSTNSPWRRIQDYFQRRGPLARLSRLISPRGNSQSGNGTSR